MKTKYYAIYGRGYLNEPEPVEEGPTYCYRQLEEAKEALEIISECKKDGREFQEAKEKADAHERGEIYQKRDKGYDEDELWIEEVDESEIESGSFEIYDRRIV